MTELQDELSRPRDAFRRLWGPAWRVALRPLTLAQGLSSLAGAGAMVIAAARMTAVEFTRFSLLALVGVVLLGLVVSALLQPALIAYRKYPSALVPWRYALIAAGGASVLFGLAAFSIGVTGARSAVLLSISAAFPVLHDWQRFRAVTLDRRWTVTHSDLLRLVLVGAALALPHVVSDAVLLQTWVSCSTLPPTFLLLWRLPRTREWLRYRTYSAAAGWQILDYALGQTLIALPLLFLGAAARSPLIGGVRLAQSVLGPLNLLVAAAGTNLVADGSTRADLASGPALVARGRRLGRLLGTGALVAAVALTILARVTGFELKGVMSDSLWVGLLLVGAATTATSWTSIHALVLRMLGQQARVTLARGLVALPAVGGFTLGYLLGGTGLSLVLGFSLLTVASPVVFATLARPVYRNEVGAHDPTARLRSSTSERDDVLT